MKVIAVNRDKYICEVSHTEIEKYMKLYYNKLKRLKVGGELDLGKGHDFHLDTTRALKSTTEFIKENKKTIEAILNGITVGEYWNDETGGNTHG